MGHSQILMVIFLLAGLRVGAQSTLHFSIQQPPTLIADAGEDITVSHGDTVRLGGNSSAAGGRGEYTYRWTPSSGLDSTDAANPSAFPDTTTTYTLTVVDAGGCATTASVTVTVGSLSAVKDGGDDFGLSIFPNPSDGIFSITSTRRLDSEPLLLEVYDPFGKLLHRQDISATNGTLDVSVRLRPTSNGLYLLRLSGSEHIVTKKDNDPLTCVTPLDSGNMSSIKAYSTRYCWPSAFLHSNLLPGNNLETTSLSFS